MDADRAYRDRRGSCRREERAHIDVYQQGLKISKNIQHGERLPHVQSRRMQPAALSSSVGCTCPGHVKRHCVYALQTSGVEVVVSPVVIPDTTIQVELFLLDTAGNELYKDQISQYWNGVYYAMLVYDVSSMDTFESCKAWFELLKSARWEGGEGGRGKKGAVPGHTHCCSPTVSPRLWPDDHRQPFNGPTGLPGLTGVGPLCRTEDL